MRINAKVYPQIPLMSLSNLDILARYKNVGVLRLDPTSDQHFDLLDFLRGLPGRYPRIQAVARVVDLPAPLIAAIQWREASGSFLKYIAQGDPLGKPAVNDPTDQPVRTIWEDAVKDAFSTHQQIQAKSDLGITEGMPINADSFDRWCAFCEIYNGEGYALHGVADPYVLAGTNGYNGGKYVADHVYSATTHDDQIGCLPMFWSATNSTPK